jgi:hypothetical protein
VSKKKHSHSFFVSLSLRHPKLMRRMALTLVLTLSF